MHIQPHAAGKALKEVQQEHEEQQVTILLKRGHHRYAAMARLNEANHGKQTIIAHMLPSVRLPSEQPPVFVGAGHLGGALETAQPSE